MYSVPDTHSGIRKIKGKIAILNITSFCNADCIFCSEGEHNNSVNVDRKIIETTVLRLKSKGVEEINFMGGESTVRDDLTDILKFIKKQKMSIYMVTNGIRFSGRKFAKEIVKYLDSIEISFHACNREMFKTLMGVDAFDMLKQAVRNIKKYNKAYVIFFNIVPNVINFPYITKIIDEIKKLMQDENFMIHIKSLNVEGKVASGRKDLVPDPGRYSIFLREAIRHAQENNIKLVISRFPFCLYSGYEYLCLEAPLELRENKSFFYNAKLLKEGMGFRTQSLLENKSSYRIKQCRPCGLKRLCPALDSKYFELFKDTSFLTPQFKSVKDLVRDIKDRSPFFRMDYSYHNYNF